MKKFFKWIGITLGSLILLVLIGAGVLFAMGNARFNKTYDFPESNIVLPTDAESIAYGKHRAETLCEGCHGPDLGGIYNWFEGGPLGTIDSANLTSGEGGFGREAKSPEDYVRAIRHGIDSDGKPIFMPAVISTSHLSDEDLAAIIAYVQSVPPVDRQTFGVQLTPLAKILYAAGLLPKFPAETVSHEMQISTPERGATVEYGEYLVNINDCRVCHGPQLNGGPYPDPTIKIITPNITPGGEPGFWTEEQFYTTLRTGVTPSGHQLKSELMPWKDYAKFYDDELKAIWLYLQSLEKLPQWTQ